MLTDGKQIAAARQLLGWSQADLANRSGISKPTIIRMEKDLNSVKYDVQTHVKNAFSSENIDFIDGGARIHQKIIHIIEGEDCYIKLLDDAFLSLKDTKQEILKSGVDERRSSSAVTQKVKSMRELGIKSRSLIEEGNDYILGPLDEYRWMDKQLYNDSDVKLIYADKVAYFMSWFDNLRVIIIQDEKISDESRRLFNFIWNLSKQPSKSSVERVF
jgi:transcriptional regulator with XRE-family HTH domain